MNFTEQLTNVRKVKDNVAEINTSPTTGNIKISAMTASRLGVVAGDYLGVSRDPQSGTVAIFKGKSTDKGNVGSKLATIGEKMGGTLVCSSGNAWSALGGVNTHNRFFDVAETAVNAGGIDYYVVTHREDVAKQNKKAKAEVEA